MTYPLPDHEGEALPAPQLPTLLGPCDEELAEGLAALCAPAMSRTRTPGQAADIGDLSGLPQAVVEVKDWANNGAAVRAALPQARAAAERLGVPYPTAWIRMVGGFWFVAMEPAVFLELHREAVA